MEEGGRRGRGLVDVPRVVVEIRVQAGVQLAAICDWAAEHA